MKNKSNFKNKLNKKNICILSDCFIPTRNSASGMIYNLSNYLSHEGVSVTCIHSGYNPQKKPKIFENYNVKGIDFITTDLFLSLRDKNIFSRFFFEFFLAISLSIKSLKYFNVIRKTDILIWYGPSSFLWLPAFLIKAISGCPVYYILRDIFPEWLYSIGIIKSRLVFFVLKILTFPQYLVPNKIGVESPENIKLISNHFINNNKIEVLYNWPSLNYQKQFENKIKEDKAIKNENLKGIYSGNFGYAQDAQKVLEFLSYIKKKSYLNIHFYTKNYKIQNEITFRNPVSENELMLLFQKYQFGVLSLNMNLKTNNIPGKFVSYTQFGLPILCFANINSTISKLILENKCGIVIDISCSLSKNLEIINEFLNTLLKKNNLYSKNSKKIHAELFNIENVKHKIENLI